MSKPLERETVLPGFTYKLQWPESDHAIYITINDIVQAEGQSQRDGRGGRRGFRLGRPLRQEPPRYQGAVWILQREVTYSEHIEYIH